MIYAEACGNTFILFDTTKEEHPPWSEIQERLIETGRDDALILLPVGNHFKMVVFGQNGLFGEFCGNGARAVAAYLFGQYPGRGEFVLETKWGHCVLRQQEDGLYVVQLPCIKKQHVLCLEGKRFVQGAVLEPHLALEGKMSDEELYLLGQKINSHQDLFPEGININVWHEIEEGVLFVKTYERGVQRLTQSCGSGSAWCALVYGKDRVKIQTPGGVLTLCIDQHSLTLIGPAEIGGVYV